MALVGMDIASVRALAQLLTSKSQEIEHISQQLTAKLNSVQWMGPDAQKFRSEWDGSHRKNLHHVAQALSHAGQAATKNANEQEQASNG